MRRTLTFLLSLVLLTIVAPADEVTALRPVIHQAAADNDVDPVMMEAIIRHESAHATSKAARNKNNLAGIMGRNGQRRYGSKEECVHDLGRILAKYKAKGRTTTAQVGRSYAAAGNWAEHVDRHMREILAGKYGELPSSGTANN